MLVPHRRDDAELGEGRLPADERNEALVFVGLDPVGGDELGRNGWFRADQRRARGEEAFRLRLAAHSR